MPSEITQMNIVYYPQLGYLVQVPLKQELLDNQIADLSFQV